MQSRLPRPLPRRPKPSTSLIVGAGISGVGGAYHLTQQCPGTSFVVLEVWRASAAPG